MSIDITDQTQAEWDQAFSLYKAFDVDKGVDDIAATIYSAMGIDWTKGINDTPSGRRFNYINPNLDLNFRPVNEVFA